MFRRLLMQIWTENRLPLEFFPEKLIIKSSKWYNLKALIPWQEFEKLLSPLFSRRGRNAIPVRQILGALIIQTDKGLTDRETIETIKETPMLQYFLGLDDYITEDLFDFTLLCKYRQKIGLDLSKDMIDILLKGHEIEFPQFKEGEKKNAGSLSIDATVVPVNITYPTDLKLLNQVREKTEAIIDTCHKQSGQKNKPRTGRRKARKEYLEYAKAKRLSSNKRWTANRIQLQYIRKNIQSIETRVTKGIYALSEANQAELDLCKTIYDQQYAMWKTKTHQHDHRIVSMPQPHVRCIVRGKAGSPYEFGPKAAVSKVNGFIRIDKISFDNFNESTTLQGIVDAYYEKHGVYPEVVRGDKIYQTRSNKMFCSERGIRLSGRPLGRPKKADQEIISAQIKEDFKKRLEIEGVFGVAKTRYGLAKLMTKLPESQKASIGLVFFVMNLLQVLSFTHFSEALEMLIFAIEVDDEAYELEDERPGFLETS
jgi:transposase, IS5 family